VLRGIDSTNSKPKTLRKEVALINYSRWLIGVLLLCAIVQGVSTNVSAQGNCLKLNGHGDYVEIPHSSSLNLSQEVTIEVWGRMETSGSDVIIGKRGNGNRGYACAGSEKSVRGTVFGVFDHISRSRWSRKEWRHITWTYTGSTSRLYVNGDLVSKKGKRSKIRTTSKALRIGTGVNGDGTIRSYYPGIYDEVRVWNRALSEREIKANMNKELTGNERGLVAYYKFNETSGRIAHDSSPYGNDGRLYGDARFVSSSAPVRPPYHPDLTATASFTGENGKLKADGKGVITVNVINNGKGDARGVSVSLSTDNWNMSFDKALRIGNLSAGNSKSVRFSLRANKSLKASEMDFTIHVSAEGGYTAPTVFLAVPIKPPYPPELSATASFTGEKGKLKVGKKGTIVVKVKNSGKGTADNVSIELSTPITESHIFFDTHQSIWQISPGDSQTVSFTLHASENLKAGEVPFTIKVSTEDGYTASPVSITVPTQGIFVMPSFPADLHIENVKLVEPSGNQALDGYESGELQFVIHNRGRGVAQNLQITISPLSSDKGLTYRKSKTIERLEGKSTVPVSFPIAADGKVESLSRKFRIQVTEEFGFDPNPVIVSFATKAFEPPDLQIKQIAINDRTEEGSDAYGNGNSIIEPNESIVVTCFVQNFGTGKAEDVKATIRLETSDRYISCPDAGKTFTLGDVAPGDYKPVNFYFYATSRYSAEHIPLKVQLTEARGDFGKIIDLGLKMNVRTQNIVDVRIAKIEAPKPTIKPIAEVAKSDVDNIPTNSQTKRPDGFAVIIGIEDYKYAPKATFANRDAEAFYGYATRVLGIPERNTYYRVNDGATAGEFKKLFELDGWLARRVTANSDVFIYYSGHGAPDIKTKSPYLIPYDIDPNYANTGFPLDQLYKNLHSLKAKSVTVIVDACFSGQSREEKMMLANARPVGITIESPLAYGDITVFAAASGREISSGYPEQRHGLFSYFFLKGLKGIADTNGDKKIIVGELFNYVKTNVPRLAGQMDREQTPQLLGRDKGRVLVEY